MTRLVFLTGAFVAASGGVAGSYNRAFKTFEGEQARRGVQQGSVFERRSSRVVALHAGMTSILVQRFGDACERDEVLSGVEPSSWYVVGTVQG